MTVRLLLLCVGATEATRAARFAAPDDALDPAGLAKARALRLGAAASWRGVVAPERSARETAAALGLAAAGEAALADQDAGAWRGRALETLPAAAVAAWIAAPERGTPGGESLEAVRARVGTWLDALAATDGGRWLAVTHAAVIRAALAHALALPVAATLAIDVAPLATVALSFTDRWRLRELRRGGGDSSP
ncbi:histidine phosphatase family protein [Sphingomonas sp. BK580]|uniref:histidine phosphatase family protein n=1 Tax=Sphingomonas sp. BK580 TaxID=2586972 RepID=UPI00160B0154|nr:histidine phosphatase family protein [Sphingomonas sp. BK580]MBB3692868.1 broad specificity phosphatase PhoE [Sphingomonas sp. BK580]